MITSKPKLFVSFLATLLVVGVVSAFGLLNYLESSDKPPSFSLGSALFKGQLVDRGLYKFEEEDQEEFDDMDWSGYPEVEIAKGINYYHADEDMRLVDLLGCINPEVGKALFVYYSPGETDLEEGFHLYPDDLASNGVFGIENASRFIIPAGRTFALYAEDDALSYCFSNSEDPTDIEVEDVVDTDLRGWVQVALDNNDLERALSDVEDCIDVVWPQTSMGDRPFQTKVEVDELSDYSSLDYYNAWVKIGDCEEETVQQPADNPTDQVPTGGDVILPRDDGGLFDDRDFGLDDGIGTVVGDGNNTTPGTGGDIILPRDDGGLFGDRDFGIDDGIGTVFGGGNGSNQPTSLVPGVITNFSSTATLPGGSITLSWVAPGYPNGSLVEYNVRYYESDGTQTTVPDSEKTTLTVSASDFAQDQYVVVDDLDDYADYYFEVQVVAQDSVGVRHFGEFSTPFLAQTYSVYAPVPGVPQNACANDGMDYGDPSMLFGWDPINDVPSGYDIIEYQIRYHNNTDASDKSGAQVLNLPPSRYRNFYNDVLLTSNDISSLASGSNIYWLDMRVLVGDNRFDWTYSTRTPDLTGYSPYSATVGVQCSAATSQCVVYPYVADTSCYINSGSGSGSGSGTGTGTGAGETSGRR